MFNDFGDKPFTILDVREDHERQMFGDFQVPTGANVQVLTMELKDLQYGVHFSQWEEENPIVCVCSQGLRAGRAAEYLRENDMTAQRLIGGTEAWKDLMEKTEEDMTSTS